MLKRQQAAHAPQVSKNRQMLGVALIKKGNGGLEKRVVTARDN
jgi:hypothetical protein